MNSDTVLAPSGAALGLQPDDNAYKYRVQPKAANVVRVGVIGYGYWGPNIVRNFHGLENCQVVAVCDKSPDALRRAQPAVSRGRISRRISRRS